MKAQKNNREVSDGNKQELYLPEKLEFLTEEVSEELMTLTDLSIALENERVRLNSIAADEKLPLEEVRITYALLRVLCAKFGRLFKRVDLVRGCLLQVLMDNGVLPIVAETWARNDSRSAKTCNPSISGSPLNRKQCAAAKKAANHDKEHGPAIDEEEF